MEGEIKKQKVCSRCKQEKDLSGFYEDYRSTDGRQSSCKKCYGEYWRKDRVEHRERYRFKNQARFLDDRLNSLEHYGGQCACCGEDRWEFLTIDHIKGGGHKQRKEAGITGGSGFFRWLVTNNFPQGFQVLCFNCNCAKKDKEKCPHQTRKFKLTISQERNLLRVKKEFIKRVTQKYREGAQKHGGELDKKDGLLEMAIDECVDLVVYLYTLKAQTEANKNK
jgi:hypothetical protein